MFPLPDSDALSSSKASTSKDAIKTYSLRALLKDSSIHPLHVLRVRRLYICCICFPNLRSRLLSIHSSPYLHTHGLVHPSLQPNSYFSASVHSPSWTNHPPRTAQHLRCPSQPSFLMQIMSLLPLDYQIKGEGMPSFRDSPAVIGGVARILLVKAKKDLQRLMPRKCAKDRQSSFQLFLHYHSPLRVCLRWVTSSWKVEKSPEVGSSLYISTLEMLVPERSLITAHTPLLPQPLIQKVPK